MRNGPGRAAAIAVLPSLVETGRRVRDVATPNGDGQRERPAAFAAR